MARRRWQEDKDLIADMFSILLDVLLDTYGGGSLSEKTQESIHGIGKRVPLDSQYRHSRYYTGPVGKESGPGG